MFRIVYILPLLTLACVELPLALLAADGLSTSSPDSTSNMAVPEGSLSGELPDNGSFERSIDEGSVHVGRTLYVDLHATGEGWAMMGGEFDPELLEEGEPTEVDPDAFVVCAGPAAWEASFDGPPDEVLVTRREVEIGTEYTVEAWIDGTGEVTGVFVVPPQDGV